MLFRFLIVLFACFLSAGKVGATHIVGMDLKYQHVSGNTYQITCIVYGDCGSASTSVFNTLYYAQPIINIFDGDGYITCIRLSLAPPDSGQNIAKYVMCPADTNNTTCTNTANPYPGVKKFIYTKEYIVPYQSHLWRFMFAGNMGNGFTAGRAAAITNILGSGTSLTQLTDTLDNTAGNNTSVNLSVEPILFFCENNSDSYNPVALDPDGDSLNFQLISGINAGSDSCPSTAGTATSYRTGFTGSNPLQVHTGTFSFDPANGEIDFNPSALQRSMVVYNIREFRGGAFVGSSQREMNFIVVACTVTPPVGTISGVVNGIIGADSTHVFVCGNTGSFSFSINPHEADTSNLIYVTPIGMPPGATYTITGDSTNAPHCVFSWNTTGVVPGSYTFFLKIQDNNCPVNGESAIAFTIVVTAFSGTITGDKVYCEGVTGVLGNSVGGGKWISSNPGVVAIDSTSGNLSTLSVGVATITYGINSAGCYTSAVVTVNPSPLSISGPDVICEGTSVTYSDAFGGGSWLVTNGNCVISTDGIANPVHTGVDTIVYRLPDGCLTQQIITINPSPGQIEGNGILCTGYAMTLTQGSAGVTWSTSNTNATIDAGGVVTGWHQGLDTVICTIGACKVTSVLTINVSPALINGSSSVCAGGSFTLTDTTAGGNWSNSPTSAFSLSSTGLVTGLLGGSGIVSYSIPDGCAQTRLVTIFPKPVLSGTDSGCTGVHTIVNTDLPGGTWSIFNTAIATVSSAGVVTGLAQGMDSILYITANGCRDTLPYPIHLTVPVSIVITDSPSFWICYGVPVIFNASFTNGGINRQLIWTVNGNPVDTGTSYHYLPLPGDSVKCILISDTVCAQPYPDTSNLILPQINLNTPTLSLSSFLGDTTCAGLGNTYTITSGDTGTAPLYVWTVNYVPVATNVHSYSFTPANGDIISCTMTVSTPCSFPNPAVVTDTLRVFGYQTPSLALNVSGGGTVCEGNVIDIAPTWLWGGLNPVFHWLVNGVPVDTGSKYLFSPTANDTVSCYMVSDYTCPVPSDTAFAGIRIEVDSVIEVQIVGSPGQLVTVGENDTLHANIIRGGISPSYQWKLNGIDIPGAIYPDLIIGSLHDKDSVTCVVATGSGTPCEGIQGFNWMIFEVGPLGVASTSIESQVFTVEPNPTTGAFKLIGNFAGGAAMLRLSDMSGRVVFRASQETKSWHDEIFIDLPNSVAAGTYLLQVETGGNMVRFPLSVTR